MIHLGGRGTNDVESFVKNMTEAKFSKNSLGDLDTTRSPMRSSQQKMKQWRIVAIVVSLIIVLLIANFRYVLRVSFQIILHFKSCLLFFSHLSIQIKKRRRRNEKINVESSSKESVVDLTDLNGTAGLKTSKNANTSSVGR